MFPQLLLTRLLFSVGAAGTSTMITAILPTMIAARKDSVSENSLNAQDIPETARLASSEAANSPSTQDVRLKNSALLPARSAGVVGLFSGCGALLALLLFLRLPDFIQGIGTGT